MQLKARDYRCIKSVDLDVSKICLVSGFNGAGKSSLLRAVASLATGDPVLGVLKKNVKDIIRGGFDNASISLGGNTIEYPKCDVFSDGAPIHASIYAAGVASILDLKKTDRTSVLQEYLKSEVNKEDFSSAVRDAGISDGMIDPVWKAIEDRGWDASQKQCAETGVKLKAKWELVTNESYGSKKAESWLPVGITGSEEAEDLNAKVISANTLLENAIRKQGADDAEIATLKEQSRNADHWAAEEVSIKESIKQANELLVKLEAKRAEIKDVDVGGGIERKCPCCDEPVIVTERREIVKPGKLNKADLKALRESIASLDGKLANTRTALSNLETDLKAAFQGQKDTAEAVRRLDVMDDGGADQINSLREKLSEAKSKADNFASFVDARTLVSKISNNAKMLLILKPDGVRQRKLIDCLDAFNSTSLAAVGDITKWPEIKIENDLSITYGGRVAQESTGEVSEAQELRVRIALQVAMAQLDRSDILVVDKADHLDKMGRGSLMRLLGSWSKPAIVAMTMPEIGKVPDLNKMGIGVSYWIEDGEAQKVGA